MRPILVCSPLQKALESRFLPKLNEYLVKRLTPCQTGFIPEMGIQVNLTRAVYNIVTAMEIKRNTYGLFIDFANAYNTVPHELLFKKLREKNCMEKEEIDYLGALYSRYRIRIGSRIIKFNKGVAQGSILSPALFNIFIEDLIDELGKEVGFTVQKMLIYADDILLLCQTISQVKKSIEIIERWSEKNGMKLNKKKSGIVVFAPREDKKIPYMELKISRVTTNKTLKKEWVATSTEIQGIPIVSKYKYLGTHLDSKLTIQAQIDFIRQKSNFLFVKLYPYLSHATAGGRKDMWRTMVYPLFNAIWAFLYFEKANSYRQQVLRLWRQTFKRFMMIPKSTNSELVDEMIGIDLVELITLNVENAAKKWEGRCDRKNPRLKRRTKPKDYLRGIPREWCLILKQQCSLCPICKNSTRNEWHMETKHNMEIFPYKEIWGAIKENYEYENKRQEKKNPIMRVKREVFLKWWKPRLKHIKEVTENNFKKLYHQL
jgi:hypothetical protein